MTLRNILTAAWIACMLHGAAAAQYADLVMRGGTVHTMDTSRPLATAVAISGNRIIYVGTDAGAGGLTGPDTRVLDLRGGTVVPGFIEGHGHLMGLGFHRMRLDLTGTKTYDDLVSMVAVAVKKAKPGEWILGRGWHQSKWAPAPQPQVRGFQTHDALSAVSPDNPVWLRHASGHAGLANARAMEIAGITPGKVFGEGGEIIRDSSGRATGIFVELAQSLISDVIGEPTTSMKVRAIETAVDECLSKGVTTFHDAGVERGDIELYRKYLATGGLKMRLWVMVGDRDRPDTARLFSEQPQIGAGGGFLTVRAVKLGIDGALGSRSAWLMEPYEDDPGNYGHETISTDLLYSIALQCLEKGYQLCVHAIGDRANHEVLNAFERAFAVHPEAARGARFRIEHAQILDEQDVPRFARLGVIAAMQGIHCTSDRPWAPSRLGDARIAEGAYVWQKLMKSGAVVINGTDTPVEPVDPIRSFYASVTREEPDGTPPGGFDPDQRMTREEALRSYTINAAYAGFEEGEKGSIEPGKLADLVVLSRDLLAVPEEEILGTEVLVTVVDGQIVFQKPE